MRLRDSITKGMVVLCKGQRKTVADWSWTCPCAIGNKLHHPKDDLLVVKFTDGSEGFETDVQVVVESKR